MYSWRLLLEPGTGADHTPLDPSCVHPVTCEAPEITGCAPGAALYTTGWPGVPESAGPRDQVFDKRYTPSASRTLTSAELSAARCVRTASCAPDREHGAEDEQVEPALDGDA
ncbi:hypothetical protein [Streptomyces camponoticapitis]|nr:hypothetical protein [Streptomyces camponoticapitis]